jgi:hypothetical protein
LSNLPAGKYMLTISMVITNFGQNRAEVICGDGGFPIPNNFDVVQTEFSGAEADRYDSMSWTFPLELGSTQTVNLECQARNIVTNEVPVNVAAQNILMTALRVDEITHNPS